MIKIKLLITTGLLIFLIPLYYTSSKKITLNKSLQQNSQRITTSALNEISQIVTPVEATNQQIEAIKNTPTGFCLNVPILMYHHIQPQSIATKKWQTALNVDTAVFEFQMAYLTNTGYTTVSLDQLALALTNHQALPPKSIVLTFDDGYEDIYTYAYPTIKKYQLKTNLMIPTGLMENIDYLTWSQLKEMSSSGLVSAYNHTWSHANLASVSQTKMESEVQTAQRQLTDNLGTSPKILAYPYGQISQNITNYLSQNGFLAAVSTISGQVQCDSFIMTLHRTRIGNSPLSSYGI